MPEVSVIIPTHNRLAFLRSAVRSVLDQTFTDFEIIIIDDGSTDETFNRFNKKKAPVRYYYQPRLGVSAARNRGINLARGTYIAFLDSDDRWHPEKLERQVQFMKEHPAVLICQTDEVWTRDGVRVTPRQKHRKPQGFIFRESLKLCLVSPSAVMMRHEYFDLVGRFDEALPVCEDYDLWLRTTYRYEVPLIEEPLTVKYGGHDDQLSRRYWGMDRFRVYALQKLFCHPLTVEQRAAVRNEIRGKCSILLNGALKRRRFIFALKIMLTRLFPSRHWGIISNRRTSARLNNL